MCGKRQSSVDFDLLLLRAFCDPKDELLALINIAHSVLHPMIVHSTQIIVGEEEKA